MVRHVEQGTFIASASGPVVGAGFQRLLHQQNQPVHAFPKIDRLGRNEDLQIAVQRDHSPRTAANTVRSAEPSTGPRSRMLAPQNAISIIPSPGPIAEPVKSFSSAGTTGRRIARHRLHCAAPAVASDAEGQGSLRAGEPHPTRWLQARSSRA